MIKNYEKISISKISSQEDIIDTKNDICYLIEIICETLKLPSDNPYLESFRQFNKNILQKNKMYETIIEEYSSTGNKIAKELINDPSKYKISQMLMNKFIIEIKTLLQSGKKDKAICLYNDMINKLKSIYNIDSEYKININRNEQIGIINLEYVFTNRKRIALHK